MLNLQRSLSLAFIFTLSVGAFVSGRLLARDKEGAQTEEVELAPGNAAVSVGHEAGPGEEDGGDSRPLSELTKGELLEKIIGRLNGRQEVLSYIPRLSKLAHADGHISYYYTDKDGVVKKLGELDKGTLIRLYTRVAGEAARLNNERILKQIEAMRNIEEINTVTRRPQQPPPLPGSPAVSQAATGPKTPPAVPPPSQPVSLPPSVPAVPRRR